MNHTMNYGGELGGHFTWPVVAACADNNIGPDTTATVRQSVGETAIRSDDTEFTEYIFVIKECE